MALSDPNDGMDTDIDWHDYIKENHVSVPLRALRYSATRRLGMYLSQRQVMQGDIVPDFGGLAELIGFDGVEIKNFERDPTNPGKAVLDEWMSRDDLEPTLGHLVRLLAQLEREDILTDCQELIAKEATFFLDKPKNFMNSNMPVQEPTVSQGPGNVETPALLTRDEVMLGRQIVYDAFLCFNAYGESGKDLEFVKELIKRFENPPYNFKLFVPHRDDLAGLSKHDIDATIISQRCRHMIVILSNNFLESPACAFQSAYAHSLSPGAKNKRLVPIKIEELREMPNIMRFMSYCDFTNPFFWDWSWDRLAKSISIPLSSEDFHIDSPARLGGILPQESLDLSSNLAPSAVSDMLPSPTPSADSGCWSAVGTSQDASSSGFQKPVSSRYRSYSAASYTGAPAPNHRERPTSGDAVMTTATSYGRTPQSPRPAKKKSSSSGLGALKRFKQTFSSSDKRKSRPEEV